MEITVTHEQGKVAVAVLQPHGALDASSYKDLIIRAQGLYYQDGTRYMLIDLSDTPFLSSAGIVAIHTIALLLRGVKPPDLEEGWEALRSVHRDRGSGMQHNLKLLNPTDKVKNVLEMVGFEGYLEILTDRAAAIEAFEA